MDCNMRKDGRRMILGTATAERIGAGYMSNRLPSHQYSGNKEVEAQTASLKVDHPHHQLSIHGAPSHT